jgi:multisubunit Na+/H+ antiporter MnhC subunit
LTFTLSLGLFFLFAGGTYLALSGSLVRVLIGFGLIGHGINLSIFVLGGLRPLGQAPIMKGHELALSSSAMDPLPQALILTAIVIGFGIQAFMAVILLLLRKTNKEESHSQWQEEELQP